MNARLGNTFLIALLAAAVAGSAGATALDDGIAAFKEQQYEKAAEILSALAEKGDRTAQSLLATLYMEGKGVERDDAAAVVWLQRAAAQGDARAQYNLGASYAEGAGVPKDEKEAAKWFLRAANQGMPFAQLNLGLLYAAGNGVAQDNVEALKWLQIALFALPPGGPRSDVARAMTDVAAKMKREAIDEAKLRGQAWRAKPE